MKTLVVIPARWGSTRLPGKPLMMIAGRTLLERTIALARAALAELDDVALVVATDDGRVVDHARALGCATCVTDVEIASGSGRALAAALSRPDAPDFVINLQGDTPFLEPASVARVIAARRASAADVVTPVVNLSWPALDELRAHKQIAPFSGTTCVRAADGRAMWFSKAVLPAIRDEDRRRERDASSPVWRHIGLYAFTFDALQRFEAEPLTQAEVVEGLEQLRMLELGQTIATVAVPAARIELSGIDTAADVARAEALIAEHGDPFPA